MANHVLPHRHGTLAPYRHKLEAPLSALSVVAAQPIQLPPQVEAATPASDYGQQISREQQKWGNHLQVEASGEWNAWLDHPLILNHYFERSRVDGLRWEQWAHSFLGRPAEKSFDLGCGMYIRVCPFGVG